MWRKNFLFMEGLPLSPKIIKKPSLIWIVLSIAALVVCAGLLARQVYEGQRQQELDHHITLLARPSQQTAAPASPTPAPTPAPSMSPTSETSQDLPSVPQVIDFDALHAENEEIISWIQVDGTRIDYPVLCRPGDDAYYHTHNVEHEKVTAGSIYIQASVNSMDWSDFHTVVYGHNMRNGSMFAGLHDFEDGDFFDAHDSVVLYTPTRRLTYRIFAAYKRDDAHLMRKFDYSTVQGRQVFLDDIFSHTGTFRSAVEVNTDSRILTLSTCVGGEDNKRYVVQAVLIEDAPVE